MGADTNPEAGSDREIKALIFDCDGTLVDSMRFFWGGWETMCAKHNLDFPKTLFYELAGTPVRRIVEIILEKNGKCKPGETGSDPKIGKSLMSDENNKFIDEFLAEKNAIIKGQRDLGIFPEEIDVVTKIVKENFAKGGKIGENGRLPMAVASSGERMHVEHDLKHRDLFKYFEAVVCIGDVKNGKPAPDLFLEAAQRIGVAPENCRGFEDAELGMQSLRAAGMEAVDVTKFEGYPK